MRTLGDSDVGVWVTRLFVVGVFNFFLSSRSVSFLVTDVCLSLLIRQVNPRGWGCF